MTWIIKLVMFICIVPSVIMMYVLGFSRNPGRKKMIMGVRDNPKFHEGEAAKKFDEIVGSARKAGLIITVLVILISVILLCLPVNDGTILAWVLLAFAMLILTAVPYGKANTELKNLKKELGITKSGVTYADLTSTNTVHALKLPWIILPNVLALIAAAAAILIDLGVIGTGTASGKYELTTMSMSLLFVAILFVPIAVLMDNTRNIVISRDSSINANYNRAKKKTWADLFTAVSWANALCLIANVILMVFTNSETALMAGILGYTAVLMVILALGVISQKRVEERYTRDTELELQDDDDDWILGMFYYNRNDTRLNVEKRLGFGATINFAHPAGMVIGVISALIIIGSFIVCIVSVYGHL